MGCPQTTYDEKLALNDNINNQLYHAKVSLISISTIITEGPAIIILPQLYHGYRYKGHEHSRNFFLSGTHLLHLCGVWQMKTNVTPKCRGETRITNHGTHSPVAYPLDLGISTLPFTSIIICIYL